MTTRTKQSRNDFDYDEIVKATSDHQKTLEEIQSQIQQLIGIVQPILDKENFAQYFGETIKSHTALNEAVGASLKKLLKDDDEVKTLITGNVDTADRKWVMAKVKSVWGFVAAIILLIAGAVVDHFIH